MFLQHIIWQLKKRLLWQLDAALDAKDDWMNLAWMERAAIMAKAAELISKKYRYRINAATMLGQGKNVLQAEIDSACEVIDYLRFNTYFASLIYMEQPISKMRLSTGSNTVRLKDLFIQLLLSTSLQLLQILIQVLP